MKRFKKSISNLIQRKAIALAKAIYKNSTVGMEWGEALSRGYEFINEAGDLFQLIQFETVSGKTQNRVIISTDTQQITSKNRDDERYLFTDAGKKYFPTESQGSEKISAYASKINFIA